jgi:hypothetical protein
LLPQYSAQSASHGPQYSLPSPLSANALSGTVSGISTANAIARLMQNHELREYRRDMITSFLEKELGKPSRPEGFVSYRPPLAIDDPSGLFLIRPVTRKPIFRKPSSSTSKPIGRVNRPACPGIFAATMTERASPGGIVTGKLPVTVHVQSFAAPIKRMGWSVRLTTSNASSRNSPGAPVPTSTNRG